MTTKGYFTPNECRQEGDDAYITLAGGHEVVLDVSDLERIRQMGRWCLSVSPSGIRYVVSDTGGGPRKRLHRILTGAKGKDEVVFRDGNALNCRLSNLRLIPEKPPKKKLGPNDAYRNSSTRIRGVSLYTSGKKPYYRVSVVRDGKSHSGGYFPFSSDGRKAAKEASIALRAKLDGGSHGEDS